MPGPLAQQSSRRLQTDPDCRRLYSGNAERWILGQRRSGVFEFLRDSGVVRILHPGAAVILIAARSVYFAPSFGALIDRQMVCNIVETTVAESRRLFQPECRTSQFSDCTPPRCSWRPRSKRRSGLSCGLATAFSQHSMWTPDVCAPGGTSQPAMMPCFTASSGFLTATPRSANPAMT